MSKIRVKQIAQDGATTGQVITWNGSTWAPGSASGGTPQWWDDVLTASGGESVITLGQAPQTRSERVWKRSSGVEVLLDRGPDYTISGATITLTTALTSGQQVRLYYVYGSGLTGANAGFSSGASYGSNPYGLELYGPTPYGI